MTRWWIFRSTGCSQIGYDDLHRNQAEFKRVAAQIDPKRTPEQILARTGKGPSRRRTNCSQSFRDVLGGLRELRRDASHRDDSRRRCRRSCEETPPFMRALTTASMDTPGPVRKGRQGSASST